MKRKLIALYAPKPQSGKTTAAETLSMRGGWTIHAPFAGLLKEMAKPYLSALGYSPAEVDRLLTIDKNLPLRGVEPVTTRRFLQRLGTEMGRGLHPDFWIVPWERKVLDFLSAKQTVLVDDMRFENEARAVRRLGGITVRVERPNHGIDDEVLAHASEGGLEDWPFDVRITNDGGLPEFRQKVVEALG